MFGYIVSQNYCLIFYIIGNYSNNNYNLFCLVFFLLVWEPVTVWAVIPCLFKPHQNSNITTFCEKMLKGFANINCVRRETLCAMSLIYYFLKIIKRQKITGMFSTCLWHVVYTGSSLLDHHCSIKYTYNIHLQLILSRPERIEVCIYFYKRPIAPKRVAIVSRWKCSFVSFLSYFANCETK